MSIQPSTSSPSQRRGRLAAGLLFGLIVAFGIWLRLDQITEQIIADDEWHAINYLLANSYENIFLHFGISDHCIPMTLLDKLVSDTVGLSELSMRALPLISGIAALFVLPALVLQRFGWSTAIRFAALLSISPVHVYFSRYARPYAVIFLFGLVGVMAFERFLSTGNRRQGVVYALCAILVPWFHPIMLPLMLAPIGFALVRELPDRARLLKSIRQIWPFAVAVVTGLLLLLAPPLINDFEVMRARSGLGALEPGTIRIGYDLLSGTDRMLTGHTFEIACLMGLSSWLLRRRTLLAYFAFLFACQAAAIAYSLPEGIGTGITLLRYALPLLGVALMLAAVGLERIDALFYRASRGWVPRPLPSMLACLAFVVWSPLLNPLKPQNAVYFRTNSWTNHALFQYQYAQEDREPWLRRLIIPRRISTFYTELSRNPVRDASAQRIVEAPWHVEWSGTPFVAYQRLHRRPMAIGFLHEPGEPPPYGELPWPDPRFHFRNYVDLADFEGLRARDVAYVVIHKDLSTELPHEIEGPPPPLESTLARYTAQFGPPCFTDEYLVVFDVRPKP